MGLVVVGLVYQVIIVPPQLTLFNSVLDWVVAITCDGSIIYTLVSVKRVASKYQVVL